MTALPYRDEIDSAMQREKILERQLAQQAGQIGALSAIIDQLNDDLHAYHPDMHSVVRTGLELAMTYKRTLLEQPANRSLAREMAQEGRR